VKFILLTYPLVINITVFGLFKDGSPSIRDEFMYVGKITVFNTF